MIADVLRKITYEGVTNVHQIAEVTGRGESTVYRWINGESQPDFASICKLANRLPSVPARQQLLDYFTQSMPVAVHWVAAEDMESGDAPAEPDEAACAPVRSCIEALNSVAKAMKLIASRRGAEQLSDEQKFESTNLLNLAVNALLRSRSQLNRMTGSAQGASSIEPSIN